MAGRLILVCGLPGAGKTTLAKELEAAGAIRLDPDAEMTQLGHDLYDEAARLAVEARQWQRARELVEGGATVVAENGFWQRWERDERREWARSVGAAIELRFVDAPVAELRARVIARNEILPPEWTRVNPDDLAEWDRVIERPDEAELALYDPPA